jgi:rhodanese-related sulfurtransferase
MALSKQIQVEEVHAALANKDISIIDVRTPGEFSKGSIAGSVNIPVDVLADKIKSVIPDQNKTIYLYCLSGSRSETAAHILAGLGYTQAYSMSHGLLMWRAKKYEITSS